MTQETLDNKTRQDNIPQQNTRQGNIVQDRQNSTGRQGKIRLYKTTQGKTIQERIRQEDRRQLKQLKARQKRIRQRQDNTTKATFSPPPQDEDKTKIRQTLPFLTNKISSFWTNKCRNIIGQKDEIKKHLLTNIIDQ